MLKPGTKKKMERKTNPLDIPGKLPFEDYASSANLADLLKILVNKGILSVEDYELLVIRGYMFPKLMAMTDDTWMEIRDHLVTFLEQGQVKSSDEDTSGGDAPG